MILVSSSKFFYCRQCGANANIEIFKGKLGFTRYVCKHCGIMGRMSDSDAPVEVTDEECDKFWRELQTDNCFVPPKD